MDLTLTLFNLAPALSTTKAQAQMRYFKHLSTHFAWLLVSVSLFLSPALADGTQVCLPSGDSLQGFRARVYSYPLGDTTAANNKNYLMYEYLTKATQLNEWLGVTDPNFSMGKAGGLQYGTLYGHTMTITNFTLELVGYYRAPQTGTYSFGLTSTDDGAMLMFNNDGAFKCCLSEQNSQDTSDIALYQFYSQGAVRKSYNLIKGQYYPIRITYANALEVARLQLSATLPDGTVKKTFEDVYYYPDSASGTSACSAVLTTEYYTGTTVTTSTGPGPSTTVYVKYPYSSFISTYMGSSETTYYLTNSQGSTTAAEILVPSQATPTSTVPWTGSYSTTSYITNGASQTTGAIVYTPISTVTTAWTGKTTRTSYATDNAGKTSEVFVLTPLPSTKSSTIPWTGTYNVYTRLTDSEGHTTEVDLLTPVSRTTASWSGSVTSTSVVTGPDGNPSIVEVFTPIWLSTSYREGVDSSTNTFSTGVTTFTGSDGIATTETIYYVETPTRATTIYSGWTGSVTATISTGTTTFTGPDGELTTETVYYVETPTVATTTYSGWTGSETTTVSTEVTTVSYTHLGCV